MDHQQLATMLSIEKLVLSSKSLKSDPKRRFIANSLYKLCEDEKISDDVFGLTMNIFDQFVSKNSLIIDDRYCQLMTLTCYNLAKKLRTNISVTNENEITSSIFLNEKYNDQEIFDAEQLIIETLDWDLSTVVPYDYISLLFQNILLPDIDLAELRLHVRTLLSLTICALNTLTILPSILCGACLRIAIQRLSFSNLHYIDDVILPKIHCNKSDLSRTQRLIEQIFQSQLQYIRPSPPPRRCLAPIDTSNKPHSSPRVK
ncbi:hypothetical protein I4U23_007333 [Adineta vaga]|nr:hypothetical protein I4U23_007333 [Adineta vaga]